MKSNNNKISIPQLSKIVHLLGETLGLVVKNQEGKIYYDKIEEIRLLSKASRISNNEKKNKLNFNRLKKNINNLNSQESLIIARAFSQFLNFVNLAESLYNMYKIQDTKQQKSRVSNDLILLEDVIKKIIRNKNINKKNFYKVAKNLNINLVLTAHPTEVKRRTLIQKYANLNNIIENFNNKRNAESLLKNLKNPLYEEITSIWKTDEIKRTRPTPLEEAKWGLAVIEDSLWNALPKICSRFDNFIFINTGKNLPINFSPISFGSWMGGDRDGNPFVTAKTTKEVILLSRWMAANLYEKELTKLIQDLSMHECSNILKKKVGKTFEPYRVFLRPIRNKMQTTQKEIELYLNEKKQMNLKLIVNSIEEVVKPLNLVYESLCDVKCDSIANSSVLDLLRRTQAFGLNLAKIDIRQEAKKHEILMNQLCKKLNLGNYSSWSEYEKISFLSKKINSKSKFINKNVYLDKENKETFETFRALKEIPKECLGAYIISMASKVSDILVVLLLQKESGILDYLRIVPLFETLSDLDNCDKIIEKLYKNSWYLKRFNRMQEVMIGYSDSSKDAGKFAASWSLYRAQEKLNKISKKYRVKLTIFHGRGGSVGRGGGPVYAALLSQPPNTVNGNIRVTEQGEVIQQKFSTESIAEYSLGTYIGSVLEATLLPPIEPKKNWENLMKEMSNISSKAYRKYFSEDKYFLKYFNNVTPQKILEKLFIGSRPTKRKNNKKIKDLRAIPWVFAWTQIRFIIPAWLGTLEALEFASKKNNSKDLKEMLNKWPFFYEMMDMLDMVLTKTDNRVILNYENSIENEEIKKIGQKLRQDLSSLIFLNKKIIPKNIIGERKEYRESVRIRNTYAETLNLLQADIMKKLRSRNLKRKEKKDLDDAMMVTIAGIAAAMKNTG
ncbi:MAG: Phosphoenolpyruvate carboxylase [Alphaproteobacteria bacterium MarineAlpha5_Bin12]|nr:MAG: Phosphoenolpyruvate carboxylase [Alphaproteobacteria bacterium MarineAlpha5_Bin12]